MQTSVRRSGVSSPEGGDSSESSRSSLSASASSLIAQLIRLPRRLGSHSFQSATMSLVTWIRRASSLSASKHSASGPFTVPVSLMAVFQACRLTAKIEPLFVVDRAYSFHCYIEVYSPCLVDTGFEFDGQLCGFNFQ